VGVQGVRDSVDTEKPADEGAEWRRRRSRTK
jgi:hypothetical protein